MTPFTYLRARTAGEAIAALAEHGDSASVIAGGQTLLLALKDRTQRPRVLVSIAGVDEFAGVRPDASGELVVGATTSYATLLRAELPGWQAEIARMAGDLADRPVRTMGTVGGGLCSGEPRYDMPALATGVDARLEVIGPEGTRSVTPDEFLVPGGTSLAAGEILTAIRFPAPARFTAVAFEKFRQRKFDAAVVSALVALHVADDATIDEARLAIGAATAVPRLCSDAVAGLLGARAEAVAVEDVARAAAAEVLPSGDDDVTAYRRELITTLTRRALIRALVTTGS